ncbi:response regulator transcription factor [Lacrimispora sp.]|uniref:response regulator transcription factor n=1 Tax=Lacrimispora sp. TaxID=2719234 RepID=UPI0028A6A0FF|nr:response regulator [Lacrimispora sp.]
MYKIIVIEDETPVRRGIILTTDWVSLECVLVGEAANGEEGLKMALDLSPDIIITDVKMPRMNGTEMVRALKDSGSQSHIIMLTAYNDFNYVQSALRLGVKDYLIKPLKNGDLENSVKTVIDNIKNQIHASSGESTLLSVPNLPLSEHTFNKYIAGAIKYIDSHCREDISLTTVARYLDISEGYLSRIFKKETNYTFTDYLIYYRIKMSMQLLKDQRLKVYEVADSVGYSDTTYFSNQFKKIVGMSPTKYQERCN